MIRRIKVGTASCGIAAGADEVLELIKEMDPEAPVVEVGCIGHCYAEPLVEIETDEETVVFSGIEATEESVRRLLDLDDSLRFDPPEGRTRWEKPYVTALAGRIDPVSLDEYREHGGYSGLAKALEMEPPEVVEEVRISGLRGRGGGGFPTGLKWSLLADKEEERKVLICNADEGDPGAFMDRSLMESLPHQVLEGMLIGAYATGATEAFIYCRAEYPLAVRNLNTAIDQIEEAGLNCLGDRVLNITIKEGAGAFVCGEETALIHSLEGKRGTPRYRPPYPTDEGYKGYPSMINNVETFGNVPLILREGGESYAETGTENSKGTKLFALAGDIRYSGLAEVPMGVTIGDVIYDIGGAEPGSVKAVQIGGPSGGCIPEEFFDTPIDYDSLNELGAIMGSGGLIAIGQDRCMVETARYFLDFTTKESCGKCTFCRVGTKRMLEMLQRVTGGEGSPEDIEELKTLGRKVIDGSLCGLGQTAPNPVLTTLKYFEDEYEAHVVDRTCPALQCDALVNVLIDRDTCIECGACIKVCPVDAISDDFVVDDDVCTRCNSCIEVCPVNAIARVPRGVE
ncbi:MAG: NADH-ubiquinone oxidoreductase-F iron-sulfur binding region domain-containing protein [Bacillota bacterium]